MPNPFRLLMDPLSDFPSRKARALAPMIDPMTGGQGGDRGLVRPFMQGALEGAGDVMSDMTSPLSIASTLLGIGGLKNLSRPVRVLRGEVNPAVYERLGAEFVPRGGEEAFNAIRRGKQATEKVNLQKVAEEGSRLTGRRAPIRSDTVDVVEMMKRITEAKSRKRALDISEGFQ